MDKTEECKQLCSFCGCEANAKEGRILIQGQDNTFICAKCVDDCVSALEEYSKNIKPKILKDGFKPSVIKDYLNNYIIDQDYAKTVLSVAVYNHYKFLEYKQQPNPEIELEKSNILIVGPTGSGKTAIVKHLAKILDVPFAIADANSITSAGYIGEDPDYVIRLLADAADWDVDKVQKGIVYIDEIDKIGRKSNNRSEGRDIGGEGVQQALLKIIEGTELTISEKWQKRNPNARSIKVDTSNILFIVGGSFEGIENIIEERKNQKSNIGIGFGANIRNEDNDKDYNELILDVTVDDFKKFGLIPEFLGRLPIICPFQKLNKDALSKILILPKNALVKQYKALMEHDKVTLEFSAGALDAIVEKAIERDTGARALRSIIDETLLKHMYDIPEIENLKKVIITSECVNHNLKPDYIYDDNDDDDNDDNYDIDCDDYGNSYDDNND